MIIAKQFEIPTATSSGVSISQGVSKGLTYWRITINVAAQEAMFGRALDASKDGLVLSVDPAPNARHILTIKSIAASDAQSITIAAGTRGSMSARVVPWAQAASDKRPSEAMQLLQASGKGMGVVKLPGWAKPALPKPGQGKSIMED